MLHHIYVPLKIVKKHALDLIIIGFKKCEWILRTQREPIYIPYYSVTYMAVGSPISRVWFLVEILYDCKTFHRETVILQYRSDPT